MQALMTPALVLLLGIGFVLHADDLDVKTYRQTYKDESAGGPLGRALFDGYLMGAFEAFNYANIALEQSRPSRQPLFCPPAKPRLNIDNVKDMLDSEIKKVALKTTEAKLEAFPVVLILLYALEENFPCPKVQRDKD